MKKSNYAQLLAIGVALTASMVWGATPPPPKPTPVVTPANAELKAALKDLSAKERTELQAVNASKDTPAEKKTARLKIRAEYRQQRQALTEKYLGKAPSPKFQPNHPRTNTSTPAPAPAPKPSTKTGK